MKFDVRMFENQVGRHFCSNRCHVTLLNERLAGGSNISVHDCDIAHPEALSLSDSALLSLTKMPPVFEGLQLAVIPAGTIVVEDISENTKDGWKYGYRDYFPGSVVRKDLLQSSGLTEGQSVNMKLTFRAGQVAVCKISNKDGRVLEEELQSVHERDIRRAKQGVIEAQNENMRNKGCSFELAMLIEKLQSAKPLSPTELARLSTLVLQELLQPQLKT